VKKLQEKGEVVAFVGDGITCAKYKKERNFKYLSPFLFLWNSR